MDQIPQTTDDPRLPSHSLLQLLTWTMGCIYPFESPSHDGIEIEKKRGPTQASVGQEQQGHNTFLIENIICQCYCRPIRTWQYKWETIKKRKQGERERMQRLKHITNSSSLDLPDRKPWFSWKWEEDSWRQFGKSLISFSRKAYLHWALYAFQPNPANTYIYFQLLSTITGPKKLTNYFNHPLNPLFAVH